MGDLGVADSPCGCGRRRDGTHEWWCEARSAAAPVSDPGDSSNGVAAVTLSDGHEVLGSSRPRARRRGVLADPEEEQREWCDEQLDWLHLYQEELSRQTELLERICRHTALLYGIAIAWLVLAGLAILVAIIGAASAVGGPGF
jgi:hypothetical protein